MARENQAIEARFRLPALAAAYYERAPARILTALAEQMGQLAERGLLRAGDPQLAAEDFAFLLVGRHLDEGMFHTREQAPPRTASRTPPTTPWTSSSPRTALRRVAGRGNTRFIRISGADPGPFG